MPDTPLTSDILRTLVPCERAAREGQPVADYFREAFHIAALRARRWSDDWDIQEFRFGGPVSEDAPRPAR